MVGVLMLGEDIDGVGGKGSGEASEIGSKAKVKEEVDELGVYGTGLLGVLTSWTEA
jgi:hypothetical protein